MIQIKVDAIPGEVDLEPFQLAAGMGCDNTSFILKRAPACLICLGYQR